MSEFFLMHKNEKCASLMIDEVWNISKVEIINQELTPYLGTSNEARIKEWWKMRSVPASRKMVEEFIRSAGYKSNEEYLAKNLALSVIDGYWICPVGSGLKWADINMQNMGHINNGEIPYHNDTSYDPNASLGGQMEKYWDLSSGFPQLVKEAYKNYGQQAVNEYFATQIHKKQKNSIPYTEYTINKIENGIECRCDSFVKDGLEFIPAYEVINSRKNKNDQSLYDTYIKICTDHGISEQIIRDFMDYQTLSDFIITNEDEHWRNFGVLRDINTLEFVTPAPIFDSGNSMFFRDTLTEPYAKHELLNKSINSMHDKEERMLVHVTDKTLLNCELLPSKEYVLELYTKAGTPENKAYLIAANYDQKVTMMKDFQRGKKITYYLAKQEFDKQYNRLKHEAVRQCNPVPKEFIMTCGLPKTGKTKKVLEECKNLQDNGMRQVEASSLYSAEKALYDTTPFFNRDQVLSKLHNQNEHDNNAFVVVSLNDIRKELAALGERSTSMYLGLIADARITVAFERGYSVIFDAMNPDKSTREKYLCMASSYSVKNKKLIILNATFDHIADRVKSDSLFNSVESVPVMIERFDQNYPTKDEGWSEIKEYGTKEKNRSKVLFSQSKDDSFEMGR